MKGGVGGCSVVKRGPKVCVHKGGDGSAIWCLLHCPFPPRILLPVASSLLVPCHQVFLQKMDGYGARWWVVTSGHQAVVGN
ncbi:hypothetical protein V6N12_065411 [Hibiscus sabdariffa]|uniref:Uncharacterized protein n=1 Tax=Hibiscus sabdariffa TaxID=183260 RepID=A0ABR2G8Y9_9ROSI